MKLQTNKKVDATGVLKVELQLQPFAGKDVTITVERTKRKRSGPQNRFYWGVLIPAIQFELTRLSGEPVSEITTHELLKQRFNSKQVVNEKTGEIIAVPLTTTDLSTTNFEVYQDECRKFAAEFFDIVIPLPNEQAELYR